VNANSLGETGKIVVQTGAVGLIARSNQVGGGHGVAGNVLTPSPCRVLVWKLKGAI